MKISFLGAGKMAEAMISSFITSGMVRPSMVSASDIDANRREFMKKQYGINMYSNNRVAAAAGEVTFLAVKPQNLEELLQEIAPEATRKHLFLSIAAGKKLATIEAILKNAKVVRVMPNLAVLVGAGMNVFCAGDRVTAQDRKTITTMLGCFGRVLELPESLFDAVTAVSGSGPAFFAYFADAMIESGMKLGLNRADAALLVRQTMLGTAHLMCDKKMEPGDLITAVKSPKGTTAAGLAVLEKSALAKIVHSTLEAAADRSRELSA